MVSGQELTAKARAHLGDDAETLPGFAIALGLRGTDSAGASRVKRWLLGREHPRGGDPDYEGTLCLLEALGAIDWLKVTGPQESGEAAADRIGEKSARARKRIEKRTTDQPRQAEGGSRP